MDPPSVFLDASAMKHAVNRRIVGRQVDQAINWGGEQHTVPVTTWEEYFPDADAPESLRAHVNALPLIAHLARRDRIALMAQVEASLEFWGLPDTRDPRGLFQGTSVKPAPDPIPYSRIVIGGPDSMREHRLRFLEGIHHRRFLQLQKVTGANHPGPRRANQLADAFHIWSAEEAGADYFLTTDLRLVRSATAKRPERPLVRVLDPTTLVGELAKVRVLRVRDAMSWIWHEYRTRRRGPANHPDEQLLEMSRRLDPSGD